ncbi:hypothetical protein GCM10022389_16510 [Flavobacterium cheonanense]|uniref:Uncharacterized protein n=1 Tax=Flavobacterium cheonanense TaxID=706183 RepID=A0ABP7VQA7_9FLAO
MFPITILLSHETLLNVSLTALIIGVIVHVVQVGSIGVQLVQGVGSVEVPVTGGPEGGVPVAVAKLSI